MVKDKGSEGRPQIIISQSPLLLLVIITFAMFVSKAIVMLLITFPPPSSLPAIAFIDSILLILLLFPILYFFLFRPWKLHGDELLGANDNLRGQVSFLKDTVAQKFETQTLRPMVISLPPLLLLTFVTSAIFVSETIVMFIIPLLPTFPSPVTAFIDSVLLVTLVFPILYFFVFRQSRSYITELSKASEILQTQFQENQRAKEALELERNKLRNILDSMNDGVYIVNQQYDIKYINPATEREFGLVNGRKCYEYLHGRREICPWCNNAEVFSGKSVQWEWYFAKVGKSYDLFGTPFINEDGTVSKLEIFHDITERKRAEEAVQKSEEKYRLLVETMNEGLGVQDENGLWTYANDRLCYMLGYFQGELIGRPVAEFFDERNQKIHKEQTALRKRGKAGSYEISWTNKDGQKILTLVSPKSIFDKDGHYKGSFAIITDITESKHAEEVLRHLSSQLLTIQEQERKRISSELHDELGQSLATLKIQQAFIEKSLREDQVELKEECKQNVTYIDQIIENVRRLSRDLSPYALEYLGLTTALKRLIIDFMKNYNIEVAFDVMDIDPLFTKENKIIIYRILQEALNNIRKHAQTAKASVAIRQKDNRVSFSIEDDGKGFDVEEMLIRNPAKKGLGLAIIGERVRMLEGSLELWSQEGQGTRITFTIPIDQAGGE